MSGLSDGIHHAERRFKEESDRRIRKFELEIQERHKSIRLLNAMLTGALPSGRGTNRNDHKRR